MVGLVLVSHSKKLAEAVRELVLQMTFPDFPIGVAGGVGETHDELGTDAVHISEVLQSLDCPEGVLVLMDLGSAVLSAETALELLESPEVSGRVRLCPAPLVEGAIAAAVRAQSGGSLEEVAQEAELGLAAKQQQLQSETEELLPRAETQPLTGVPGEGAEIVLEITNQHGLHARPAAALVQTASRFSSAVDVTNLTSGRGPASARSLTSLSLLQIRKGDRVKVACSGADCQAAMEAIRELAAAGFGDKPEPVTAAPPVPIRATVARGLPGADGIAIGPLFTMQTGEISPGDEPAGNPAAEFAKLTTAMNAIREEVGRAKNSFPNNTILEAQALILADPVIVAELRALLQGGLSAGKAWSEVTRKLASQYEAMEDAYLRERAADVRDLARRVLRQMKGADSRPAIVPAVPSILFADELLPSEASGCDPSKILGVISAKGSATSHAAILLRTLGIPMVVGATGIGEFDAGKTVAINGSTGDFWIDPDAQTIAALKQLRAGQRHRREQAELARTQPSVTLDGVRIEVLANAAGANESTVAAENGAEGIGLLRAEFLFVSRKQAPTEDEQVSALLDTYAPISGPLIVRSLDVGADKPLPFLAQPEEHNPYLGIRGIRLSLHAPELFLTHLRAILRSGVGRDIWLMFPMVSVPEEAHRALQYLERAHEQLQSAGTAHAWPIKRGVMIEVPSAALLAAQLAEDLDFFSIGTNDLTQYTMAAERGNASVATLQDALHPAVLRLMKLVVEGGEARGRHVSVCGDAASDPASAAIFVGLGIRSLSVRPRQAAEIKALFRNLEMAQLQNLGTQALQSRNATEVRRLIAPYIEQASREVQPHTV
jgi:phosphocarrier protein FPr